MLHRKSRILLIAFIALLLTGCGGASGGGQQSDVGPEQTGDEPQAAVARGAVFADENGNGVQDEGEPGLPGVHILAEANSSTASDISALTNADGEFSLATDVIDHRVSVDPSSLPSAPGGGSYQLTTSRSSYNLNVPPGFTAPGVDFGYQEVASAEVYGLVFEDANGNGVQDAGETGLPSVSLRVVNDDTGALSTVTTDGQGIFRFAASVVNHRFSVQESTLPFEGQLTTGRQEYNLNVPPGFTAPNVNFGYQEVQPAAATGIVFEDRNANGEQDASEPGLPDVTVRIVDDDSGELIALTTDSDGHYRFETTPRVNHRISIETSTLPFPGQLTTGRQEYNLNVPPGFTAPNVNFGYQRIQPGAATGIVFEDANGNGVHDEGEAGLPSVSMQITDEDSGIQTTITTDSDGVYRFSANGGINHEIAVVESTLPFSGQLTTGRQAYNLNVPPGFTAPNVNFGYQKFQPAAATGLVFEDQNGNGVADEGEPRLSGVTVRIQQDGGSGEEHLTTDGDGHYRYEHIPRIDHRISVDESTLPFFGQLTTGRQEYNLNVPPGFTAPNVNFGYQRVQPAVVTGIVFLDANRNGVQDEDEAGMDAVHIDIELADGGNHVTVETDGDGHYRYESREPSMTVRVDETSLPSAAEDFGYTRTSGRDAYHLNVPYGFTAPNVNFGYAPAEPAEVTGTVFRDANSNGALDPGEAGIADVRLEVDSDRVPGAKSGRSLASGEYTLQTAGGTVSVRAILASLPEPGEGMMWSPTSAAGVEYHELHIPSGYTLQGINFGFEQVPTIRAGGGSGSGGGGGQPSTNGPFDEDATNPFEDPQPDDERLPEPDPSPDEPPTGVVPLAGTWTSINHAGSMNCGAFSMPMQPSTEQGNLEVLDEGARLRTTGMGEQSELLFEAVPSVLGRYTADVSAGPGISIHFVLQVVQPDYFIGYLVGTAQQQGVSCQVYRSYEGRHVGG